MAHIGTALADDCQIVGPKPSTLGTAPTLQHLDNVQNIVIYTLNMTSNINCYRVGAVPNLNPLACHVCFWRWNLSFASPGRWSSAI